jgi:ParB family chromosome partitioning protein
VGSKQKVKPGLGKGLNALLPAEDYLQNEHLQPKNLPSEEVKREAEKNEAEKNEAVKSEAEKNEEAKKAGEVLIPLEKLRGNPHQPRKYFDEESLRELADSIREHGVIQPIIAEDSGDGTYRIVAGERRNRAAALAGLSAAPVLIRNYTDENRLIISLIENIQRTDLNPIEEASAYRRLMDLAGLSQEEVSVKVGKKRSTVANTLRLLNLPQAMQDALETGAISPGHARALLAVEDPARREQLFQKMIESGISVRTAEKLAAPERESPKKPQDPNLNAIAEKLIEVFGTKVTIEGDFRKGSIRIAYYSAEDLDRLYDLLTAGKPVA